MNATTTNPFVGTWKIRGWDNPEDPRLFPIGGELTIRPVESGVELTWKDELSPPREHKVPFTGITRPDRSIATQAPIEGESCTVILTVANDVLTGKIKLDHYTGPAGTFIADASNGDGELVRKSLRWPRWRHWLRRLVRRFDKSLAEERNAA